MVVTRCALDVVKTLAHRHEVTVNVLLTAASGVLRQLLIRRGGFALADYSYRSAHQGRA